ncbi:Gti1/Pac2 family-domain-containing protein [Gymnopilus junonius]|uniref:Gti1/Pac2 family-domain-containing protein n=1 Tax=Gymnopilus junonius TaxID=109634 RepID=A0A9P5NM14_GYMJU|nr:Gti1/Pac2 family-domain-containing protein [Gymnopilus junonius]
MQHPTLQNVKIRSTRDALQVFHGVATHRLPLITRRLDAEERRNIMPGNVYVWEERGANTEPTGLGMERWTDGMGWGPSRVRDEFLFYHQKDSDTSDDLLNPVTPWAQMMRRPSVRLNNRPFSVDVHPLLETERLIKQTYSVHVSLPGDRSRGVIRKWHLTAYFSPQTLDGLDTIDNIRGVGDVTVPEGWFRSARIGRNRRDSRAHGPNSVSPESPHQPSTSTVLINSPSSHQRLPQSSHPPSPSAPSGYPSPPSPSPSLPHSNISHHSMSQLVPLEVLVRTSGPRRDPVDEQLLRRFSS